MDKTSRKNGKGLISRLRPKQPKKSEKAEGIHYLTEFPAQNPYPVLRIAEDGTIIYGNKAGSPILRQWQCKQGQQVPPDWLDAVSEVLSSRRTQEYELECEGKVYSLTFAPLRNADSVNVYGLDITSRKQSEEEREVMIKLLSLINSSNRMREMMRLVLVFLEDWSGCEAVGIRLAEGEDFPYYVTSGFSDEFIEAENRLCSVNEIGELVRDSQGRPFLECMCGNVISGRFDPTKPFFTKHGSFWTNSTTELLVSTTKADRPAKTRNRCNTAGYESVALIPLRAGEETFGLLQFNDKQKNQFTLERISLFERLADNFAIGLAQRKAQEKLRTNQARLSDAMQIAKLGYWEFDIVNEVFIFNDQFYSVYKTSAEQVGGYKISPARYAEIFLFPEDASEFRDEIRKAVETTDPEFSNYVEHRVIFGNGQIGYVSVRYFVIKDDRGHTIWTYGVNQDIAERKEAEQAQKKAENEKATILNTMSELVVYQDAEHKVIWANRAAGESVGSTAEKLLGRYCYEIWQGRDKPCANCPVEKAWKTGRLETEEVHNSDDKVWSVRANPVKNEAGKVIGVVEVTSDITERKRAELTLRQSELRHRTIIRTSMDGFWLSDLFANILEVNDSCCKMSGYSREELTQMTIPQIEAAETPGEVKQHIQRIINDGSDRFETVHRRKDGSLYEVEVSTHYLPMEGGRLFYFFRDITENKRAEKALQESEERFRRALENIPDVIVIYGPDLRIRYINSATQRITGHPASYFIGRRDDEVWPPEVCQVYLPALKEAFSTRKTCSLETDLLMPGAGLHNLKITCVPIVDEKDEVREVVGITHDLTERKQAEQELQESEIRYSELFENMSNGVAVYEAIDDGRDFVFRDMNQAGEYIGKVRRDEIIGRKVTEVFPGVKDIGLLEAFRRVLRTGKPQYHPVSFYKDKRLAQWVENYVYKLPSGVIVTVYDDVTQRRQTEEKMAAYHGRLRSLASQLAMTEEQGRRRIAMELHDNVGQTLAFAKMELDSARQTTSEPTLNAALENVSKSILKVIDDLHTLSFDLSSPVLREYGLEAAIADWLEERLQKMPGLQGKLIDDGREKPLDDDMKATIFRAVRELVTNTIKYARASRIEITVERIGDKIQVIVRDDGTGFDIEEVSEKAEGKKTFGLFSIEEQLNGLGGGFKIFSEPGEGTKAILTAPVKKS